MVLIYITYDLFYIYCFDILAKWLTVHILSCNLLLFLVTICPDTQTQTRVSAPFTRLDSLPSCACPRRVSLTPADEGLPFLVFAAAGNAENSPGVLIFPHLLGGWSCWVKG